MWFTETPWPPMALFLSAAIVLGVVWSNAQRGIYLAGIGLLLALGAGTYALEQAIVTDRERIEESVHDLVHRFQRNDLPGTLQYISASPQAETLRLLAERSIERVELGSDFHVTDVQVTVTSGGTRATSHFRVNGTVGLRNHGRGQHQPFRFRARWQKEAGAKDGGATGGGWKMIEIEDLDPINGTPLNRFNRVEVSGR